MEHGPVRAEGQLTARAEERSLGGGQGMMGCQGLTDHAVLRRHGATGAGAGAVVHQVLQGC